MSPSHARTPPALSGTADTEFALLRESLGVSINHILGVHGRKILEEQSAAAVHDETGQRSLERLFLNLTQDSMTQATLIASQSGNRVQESARRRCSGSFGSPHRTQTAHPGYDPRRSLGRPSPGAGGR